MFETDLALIIKEKKWQTKGGKFLTFFRTFLQTIYAYNVSLSGFCPEVWRVENDSMNKDCFGNDQFRSNINDLQIW